MKSLIPTLVALFFGALVLRAQPAVELYLTEEELPDLVQCLPAPPDTIGEAFTHDIMRYMWGKTQRLDPERLAVAKRDAVWDLDTLRAIYSVPFGMEISPEKTPEIYRAFVNGISTVEQIRFRPKAHYFRMRPYARFKEASIFPQDNPEAAEALFARAFVSGESRVIAGCHWQSDVDASATAACIGYARMQTSLGYRVQIALAREEFRRLTASKP